MPYIPVATVSAAASGGGLFSAYAQLSYTVASGTDGGTSTAGSWQTRPLNTEDFDPGNIVSLSSNQFVLAAGTYFCRASCFFENPNARVKLRIRNITDGSTSLVGLTQWMPNAANAVLATMNGRFILSGTKTLELQYFVQTGVATDGLGVNYVATAEVEIYADLTLWKEA